MNLIVLVLCFLYVNGSIVYTAFDMEGNNASCTISVEIADTEPPVINASTCVDVTGPRIPCRNASRIAWK